MLGSRMLKCMILASIWSFWAKMIKLNLMMIKLGIFHFLAEVEEEWHTILNLGVLCATDFSFFGGSWGGVAHDFKFGRFVCHKFFIFPLLMWEKRSRRGTQNLKKPICVPKLASAQVRGRARLAHKYWNKRFVCQRWPRAKLEAAPGWHTNLEKTDLCANIDRKRARRQRRSGTQNAI